MKKPFAAVERDASIKAWEVAIGFDDTDHDVFIIHFFDDGRTELKRWTAEEFKKMFEDDLFEAIKEGARRLGKIL